MHFLFNFAQTRPWEGTHKENGSENSSLYKYIAFSWEILQYFFLKKGAFTELRYYASNFDTFKKTVLLIFLFIDGADAIYLVLFSQKFKVKLLFRATGFANKIC